MSPPAVITKVTGHVSSIALAGDIRYLNETISRGNWQFKPLTPEEIRELVGKNRRLFMADEGGPIIRFPAQTILVRGKNGVMRQSRTGKISTEYVAQLEQLRGQGKRIYQRIVIGIKPLADDHGYILDQPHGTIVPLTWSTRLRAQEKAGAAAASTTILSQVLRDAIRLHAPSHRAVKTITSVKKMGRSIVAHNLTVAPHPKLLQQIRRAGQPIDKVLEVAARRALERIERKIEGQITAVASTHIQDSTGIRPHLHVRMAARASNGKYIALFDGKGGSSRSGRCILQQEIERQIRIMIERWEPRGRD
ncbi:MAG: hypothetical protein LV481_05260 [Methylacidiphilales bacterium]|nr:hypothetical protein [Candidatus Methylacidiphilales bacterium]